MSAEPALLAAIAASPDDDLPRLVYADWLDENGREVPCFVCEGTGSHPQSPIVPLPVVWDSIQSDGVIHHADQTPIVNYLPPTWCEVCRGSGRVSDGRPLRAEFIRLQIEIAKKETLPRAAVNAFSHLWKRQQEILDEHRRELLGPLADVVTQYDYEFRRGFLERLTLQLDVFLDHADTVGTLRPLPSVRVIDSDDSLDRLSQAGYVESITELQVERDGFIPGFEFAPTVAADLVAASPRLTRLTHLHLENCGLGDIHTDTLFAPPCFPALQELDLSCNDLTDAGVIALLNTGVPQRLKRLVLGGNPIGDQAAVELADRLGGSTVLENLNLRMTNIGPNGQAALLARLGGKVDLF